MKCFLASIALLVTSAALLPGTGVAQPDPAAIFRQAIEARNRGDIAAMMVLFADDAVREDGSCPQRCVGLDAVRRAFQKNIDEHSQADLTFVEGTEEIIKARADISSDALRAQSIEKRTTSYIVKLKDRKIILWRSPLPQAPSNEN